jgi:hypothetical protein
MFELPDNIEPFALVPLGFPNHATAPSNRLDASRVHLNKW